MPAVDISPLMNHPAWGNRLTPAQRKQALDVWQDPTSSDNDRTEMLKVMDQWQAAPAEPSGAAQVVSSVGGMLKEVPGLAYEAMVAPFVRAGGYDPNAPPRPPPQTPQEWEARTLDLESQAEKGSKGVLGLMAGPALGRAGYAAGEALMPLVTRLAGQTVANALPAVGEAGASYAARQANVAAGNEPAGPLGDVASVLLPLGARAATSAPVARRLPGSAVAQHEMAAEDIRQGVERMQPTTPAETLYRAVVQQGNPAIPVQDLRQTVQELIAMNMQRGAATRDPQVLRLARELDDLAGRYHNQIPMDILYDRMQKTGEILGHIQSTGDRGARDISRIYAAFHGALENASQSNIPGAETLQNAIRASRQEHAADRLGRIVGQGRGIEEQQGTGYTFVRGKNMLNAFERLLADDDVFRGSFTPQELADMRSLFERGVELPALPPPGSAQRGFGLGAIRGSIGGGVGYVLGGPEGAAIGTAAGIAAPEVIGRLMLTDRGRQYLRAALAGQGGLSPQTLAVLGEVVRAELPAGQPYTSKRSGTRAP
jgi:hypothetical protein